MAKLNQILEATREFVKKANAQKEALTGEAPSSLPGAEKDKPVPAEAGKADPEVKADTQLPGGVRSTDGAKPADPLLMGETLKAEQPAETPKKLPMTSDNANAPTPDSDKAASAAARLGNEILSTIRSYQKAAEAKPAEKAAEKPAEKAAEAKPADKPAEAPAGAKEAAGTPALELTTDIMAKLAAFVLSTDEGVDFVEKALAKEAGAEAAAETLQFLAAQSALAEKQAAYDMGVSDADALIAAAQTQQTRKAAAAQPAQVDFFKLGQDIAAASMEDLLGAAGDGAGGIPAEALAGEGAMPEGEPAEDGDIAPEELEAVLTEMVQNGELTEEDIDAILAELGAGDAGAAPAATPEEVPAEKAPAASEGDKEASK